MVWLGFTSVKNAKIKYGYGTAAVFIVQKAKLGTTGTLTCLKY